MSTTPVRQVVAVRMRPELKSSLQGEAAYQERSLGYIMEQAAIEYLQRRNALPPSIQLKPPRSS